MSALSDNQNARGRCAVAACLVCLVLAVCASGCGKYDRQTARTLDQKCLVGDKGACTELHDVAADACMKQDVMSCRFAGDAAGGLGQREQALSAYGTACHGGDGLSCLLAARMAGDDEKAGQDISGSHPDDLEKEMLRSLDLTDMTCEGGVAVGCGGLHFLYADGEGSKDDNARAEENLTYFCNHKEHARSCWILASAYEQGLGVKQDTEKANFLNAEACELGFSPACRHLAHAFYFGKGVRQDYRRALGLLNKGCGAGDGLACNLSGVLYSKGYPGIIVDLTRAFSRFRYACVRHDPVGCHNMAVLYTKGTGVTEDRDEALAGFNEACDGGVAIACATLASMYASGRGVIKDLKKSADLADRACALDEAHGCAPAEHYTDPWLLFSEQPSGGSWVGADADPR